MRNYIDEVIRCAEKIDMSMVHSIASSLMCSSRIYAIGNGGSMALAVHLAQDLQKYCGMRAYALDNISAVTAYGNDIDYEVAYERQLRTFLDSSDALIMFSWSGASKNLLACTWFDCVKIGIIGKRDSMLAENVNQCLVVDTDNVQVAEDIFSIVCHLIVRDIKQSVKEMSE